MTEPVDSRPLRERVKPEPAPLSEKWAAMPREPSTSERLRQTQQALAASQADLTRMERDGRILARLVAELTWGRDEARACWSQAERDLTMLHAELASATAELEQLRAQLPTSLHTEEPPA